MKTPPRATRETYLYKVSQAKASDALNIAWCYPASYAISMASLGYLMLFARLDKHPETSPQRFTTEDFGKTAHLKQADVIGFSFSFELDILEILRCFQAEGFPLRSEDRGEDFPLVFAGGPVPSTNPEPYAPFLDFFLIGDGEELLIKALLHLKMHRHLGKRERLKSLAQAVEGVYVPCFYEAIYAEKDESGHAPLLSMTPNEAGIPRTVKRQSFQGLEFEVATLPILSEASVFGKSFLVEVMRGCSHRCRFCLASYSTLPARPAGLGALKKAVEEGLKYTNELGLVGALIADHPDFEELCAFIRHQENLRVSFGALRADTLTKTICETLAQSGSTNVTLAIESGSPWLRRRINKNLKQETIFQAAEQVAQSGLKGLKLYHMIGLPNEEEAHLQESIELIKSLHKAHPQLKLSLGCSTFVPKAWTPFQWMPRLSTSDLKKRMTILQKGIVHNAEFRPSSPKWDTFQAMVSRGDRRLAPFLERFSALGATHGHVNRAMKELQREGIDVPTASWYGERERPEHELLPWDVLEQTVSKPLLWKESLIPSALKHEQH
jgi:radical SAM superfamily enzyme YgiQ (UPF0313 family)